MAASQTLRLVNRSPKQPVKRLPASVDLPAEATVEDLKIAIAKKANIGDFNRVGLFDPSTKKTLKDRKARVRSHEGVATSGEVLVKDLGPQVAWRTVFMIEYFGPLLLHPLAIALRPYMYTNGSAEMSQTQWLVFAMIMLHFVKRELETMFVHKFSANSMPFFNIFRNSFFYWALSGVLCAYSIYRPTSLAATANTPAVDAAGVLLYLIGELSNASVHWYLSTLRSRGGTERSIPVGYGFSVVTCPNYMYEVMAWAGIIIVSRDWSVALFILVGTSYMYTWARGKERAYRKEFGDKYKKKRYVMLPGLL